MHDTKFALASLIIGISLAACDEGQSAPELAERDALLADVGLSDDELPADLEGLSTHEMAAELGVGEDDLPEQLEGFVRTRDELLETLNVSYDDLDPSLRDLSLPELARALDPDGATVDPDDRFAQDLTASEIQALYCVGAYQANSAGFYRSQNFCGYSVKAKVVVDGAPDTFCVRYAAYQVKQYWTWGTVRWAAPC